MRTSSLEIVVVVAEGERGLVMIPPMDVPSSWRRSILEVMVVAEEGAVALTGVRGFMKECAECTIDEPRRRYSMTSDRAGVPSMRGNRRRRMALGAPS